MSGVHWTVAALHKARLEDGLSHDEVGRRVGRAGDTVRGWEAGRTEPGLSQIEAWAATHGLYLTLTPDRPQPAPLAAQAAEMVLVARVRRMFDTGEARRIRQAAGLTARDAGAAVGVDHKSICKWENGQSRPQAATAVAYGRFLVELRRALHLPPSSGEAP